LDIICSKWSVEQAPDNNASQNIPTARHQVHIAVKAYEKQNIMKILRMTN